MPRGRTDRKTPHLVGRQRHGERAAHGQGNQWRRGRRRASIDQVPALHDDELAVDVQLVRQLVEQSLPHYAGLRIQSLMSSGSSNALFHLGNALLVRMPRQPGGSTTIEKEARWLPVIAQELTTAVPEVVAVGQPAFGYPEKWAVTKWLDGQVPEVPWGVDSGSSHRVAHGLAQLVAEFRQMEVPPSANDDPTLSSYRGGRLADMDREFRQSVDQCRPIADLGLDLDHALNVWDDALAAEQATAPLRSWYHGDLLAENLLIRNGELAAVLDFGGLAVGDPSVDLIVAWEVLDPQGRQTFKDAISVDDAAWARGMGWALLIAMITFPYYWHTMPARCAARRSMAAAVLAEA
jgi:aminoglycoside phosphotransferase (APT) family kinase protein